MQAAVRVARQSNYGSNGILLDIESRSGPDFLDRLYRHDPCDSLAGYIQGFRRGRHRQADRRQDVFLDNLTRMDGRQSVFSFHKLFSNGSLQVRNEWQAGES